MKIKHKRRHTHTLTHGLYQIDLEFINNQHLSFLVKQQYTGDDDHDDDDDVDVVDDYDDVNKNDFNTFFLKQYRSNLIFGTDNNGNQKLIHQYYAYIYVNFKYGNNKVFHSFYSAYSLNDTYNESIFVFIYFVFK